MSLDGTIDNCELNATYPGNGRPASLTFMNGSLLACGGHSTDQWDKCYRFDGTSWSSIPNSNQLHCKYDSQNLVVSEGWWNMGRLQLSDGSCSREVTSEIYDGTKWIAGPAHFRDQYSGWACTVNLNSTHSMFIGGDITLSNTYLYNSITGMWTETGSLNTGRLSHGCVNIEGEGVLALGGYELGEWNAEKGYRETIDVFSVELYNPLTGRWTIQPDMPRDINPGHPKLFSQAGGVIALFKNEDKVYERTQDGEWKVLEGVQLQEPFDGFNMDKAVLVPDNFMSLCTKVNIVQYFLL